MCGLTHGQCFFQARRKAHQQHVEVGDGGPKLDGVEVTGAGQPMPEGATGG
jgi:hypothetical protein